MKIQVGFNEEWLQHDAKRGASLVFYIAWEHEGYYYPDQKWSDFGEVILGWWTTVILEFVEGTDEDEFEFMDGPFSLKAKYDRQNGLVELRPKKTDLVWVVPFKELTDQIRLAARVVSEELDRLKIKQRENLEKCIELLEEVRNKPK